MAPKLLIYKAFLCAPYVGYAQVLATSSGASRPSVGLRLLIGLSTIDEKWNLRCYRRDQLAELQSDLFAESNSLLF